MLLSLLHVALSRAQGGDMARRWSPEYRIRLPTPGAGASLELRDVKNYVKFRECTEDCGEEGAFVMQHTTTRGLALFLIQDEQVVAQLPSLNEEDELGERLRDAAVHWWRETYV